jgi:signal transduction histidine kinase
MSIRILYLDDELQNLNSFKAAFRRTYTVFTTDDPEEAIRIIRDENIQIAIADHRMPNITGVEFFTRIKEEYPDPVRILLTGYSDLHTVIEAINSGQVFRFIDKPWEEDSVKHAIQSAAQHYETKMELKRKKEELNRALEELDSFVYSISHDVRAPLMAMWGLVNVARMDADPYLRAELLDYFEQSIQKLDGFLNNLLDYFRNKRLETAHEVVDLKALLEDAIALHKAHPSNQDVLLNIEIDNKAPFYSDPHRLRLVLGNILTNAFTYQKLDYQNKRIEISIVADSEQLDFKVSDNGIGISPQHIPHIFKIFYRADKQSQGAGIGLYVVKEVLEKLKGQIIVESDVEKGSTFHVVIPNLKQ